MQIDGISGVKGNKDGDFDTTSYVDVAAKTPSYTAEVHRIQPVNAEKTADGQKEEEKDGKEPSHNTIKSVFSEVNQKMRMSKTRCEYSYDEPTKRVSIKVFDKDTDQLIREVPPEKSLEMLQKMWELAGIIVDEKR